MVDYLIKDKQLGDLETNYSVQKISWKRWAAIIILTIFVVFLNLILLASIPAISLYVFLTTPLIILFSYRRWKITSKQMVDALIMENAKIWMASRTQTEYKHGRGKLKDFMFRTISGLMGITMKSQRVYYLEGEVVDLDLSDSSIMKRKYIDLFSACLGITFLIGTSIRNSLQVDLETGQLLVLMSAILIIPFSIYLASWMVPMLWVVEDANIKSIDNRNMIHNYSQEIKDGFISRFLGFAGFIIAFSESFRTAQIYASDAGIIGQIFVAFIAVFLFWLVIVGTAVLLANLYLTRVHQERVNYLRKEISKILYLGSTSVRLFSDEELIEYFDLFDQQSQFPVQDQEIQEQEIDSEEITKDIEKGDANIDPQN